MFGLIALGATCMANGLIIRAYMAIQRPSLLRNLLWPVSGRGIRQSPVISFPWMTRVDTSCSHRSVRSYRDEPLPPGSLRASMISCRRSRRRRHPTFRHGASCDRGSPPAGRGWRRSPPLTAYRRLASSPSFSSPTRRAPALDTMSGGQSVNSAQLHRSLPSSRRRRFLRGPNRSSQRITWPPLL